MSNIILEVLASALRQENEIKRSKTIFKWHDFLCKKTLPSQQQKILVELISGYKITGYKVTIQKSIDFLFTINEHLELKFFLKKLDPR